MDTDGLFLKTREHDVGSMSMIPDAEEERVKKELKARKEMSERKERERYREQWDRWVKRERIPVQEQDADLGRAGTDAWEAWAQQVTRA